MGDMPSRFATMPAINARARLIAIVAMSTGSWALGTGVVQRRTEGVRSADDSGARRQDG